jgi:homoserine dehydrogenase
MIEIAILGFGVVGSGVAEVIQMNQDIIRQRSGRMVKIKKILDIRDFSDHPLANRITRDPDEIMNDPEICVVVETLGGVEAAYDLSTRALKQRKHVVTSNKELVAVYGPELMALARSMGVSYMFEASVGGGIPIVRPLHKCLSANVIDKISGILNGTTNFILTMMDEGQMTFADALSEAKSLGYTESDPLADINGLDPCRKIAILTSITFSEFIDYRLIYTEGISAVTKEDMAAARRLGCKIKLIGRFRRCEGNMADLIVAPMLVARNHPIAIADDVNNAILVEGNALGEAMFFGRGAGRLPTASAVVADVMECVMHLDKTPHLVPWQRSSRPIVKPHADCQVKALLRLKPDMPGSEITDKLGQFGLEWHEKVGDEEINVIAGLDGQLSEATLDQCLEEWGSQVISRIRVF